MTLSEQQTDERAQAQGKQSPPGARRHVLVEWVVIVIVALVAALLIKTFAIQAFYIPSQSMEPTLMPGDRVLVNKLAYDFHPVHTDDIVVFRRPPNDTTPGIDDLIKRVIGLPGQTVDVANCGVYINGKELAQPYLPKGWQEPTSEYCTTWPASSPLPDPYKVPKGYYFVMGDNRQDSYDSRYWGPLPDSYLVGRAFLRMWPPGRIGFL
jgi:signal peptidase I